jgi:hypothetical protein
MRAPRRSDDEIVSDMLKLLNPARGERAALRAKLLGYAVALSSGCRTSRTLQQEEAAARIETTRQGRRYHQWLLTKRRQLAEQAWAGEHYVAALDAEIERVQQLRGERHGGRPRDFIAETAVLTAARFLPPERRTLTVPGAWHTLSMLFVEAATGEVNAERVWGYMQEMAAAVRGHLLPP